MKGTDMPYIISRFGGKYQTEQLPLLRVKTFDDVLEVLQENLDAGVKCSVLDEDFEVPDDLKGEAIIAALTKFTDLLKKG